MSYISQEDYKNLMSKFQKETPKGILKEALDDVGEEDKDPDNDGTPYTASDKYILKRRKAISKAVKGDVDEYGYADNYPGSWGYRQEDNSGDKSFDFHKAAIESASGDKISHIEYDDYDEKIYWSTKNPYVNYYIGGDEQIIKYDGKTGERYPIGDLKNYDMEEGLHTPPLQATGPTVSVNEGEDNEIYIPNENHFKVKVKGKLYKAMYHNHEEGDSIDLVSDNGGKIKGKVKKVSPDGDLTIILPAEEGLHMSPLQATGQTAVTNEDQAPYGFSVLSPDERKQLKEYIESIKTIKKEIAKLTDKAGKKVKEGDLGGDRTGLMMTQQTISEMGEKDYDRIESHLDVKLHDAFEKVTGMVIKNLVAEGIPEDMIEMYLKYEIEKKAHEAIMSQHD